MNRKVLWLIVICCNCLLLGSAWGENYPVPFDYKRTVRFPCLQTKIGPVLGIAPCEDRRLERSYVGRYASLPEAATRAYSQTQRLYRSRFRGNGPIPLPVASYLTSEPVTLGRAMERLISKAISQSGVQTVSVPAWDRKVESMGGLALDSVLGIIIKTFWVEAKMSPLQTKVNLSIHLISHLGVRRLGRVFTKNVVIEKNVTFGALGPLELAQLVNRTASDALESVLRDAY
jgi:hypothetical protein